MLATCWRRKSGGVAVHFIDLDHFKNINNSFGHDGGDFLLKTIAARLSRVWRGAGDMVARLGGDEFVVAPDRCRQQGTAVGDIRATRRRSRLGRADAVQGTGDRPPRCGSALRWPPTVAATPERLLKSADLALYKSQVRWAQLHSIFRAGHGRGAERPTQQLESEHSQGRREREDSYCIFQPMFEVGGGPAHRLRGPDPVFAAEDGSLIPPLVFIPVAEEMRLIDKIGEWVLKEACRIAGTWPNHLTVAVNLSPLQFTSGNLGEIVESALKGGGLDASRLELEITESLLLDDDDETVMKQLRKLKAMGVAIVMDDFGTGYSSLSYLWRFPFDKIKIDRSFMLGLDSSGRDAETVVKTIIALGRELRMRVTVEGVESPSSQAAFLKGIDSDQAQGFFFGRPVSGLETSAVILNNFQEIDFVTPTTRQLRKNPDCGLSESTAER